MFQTRAPAPSTAEGPQMLGERIAVIARPSEKLKCINKPPSSPYIIKMWLTAFYVLQNYIFGISRTLSFLVLESKQKKYYPVFK